MYQNNMLENYLNLIDYEKCTGCGACMNSCPFGAISMQEDEFGFFYPVLDKNKCRNCGKCKKVCPILHILNKNTKSPKCYAVMANNNIRTKSSSGGFFSLAAQALLTSGGGYICGAAYKPDFSVAHIIINNTDDLDKLRGSKYLQSSTGNCYKNIENLLKSNNKVLFTGCPCQIAGLNSYLGKSYENLFTIELLCHGVPSYKIFRKYLDENYNIQDIEHITFRDKSLPWSCTNLFIYYKSGKRIIQNVNDDAYEAGFHKGLLNRTSCAPCAFAKLPRQADITIADWWGIKNYAPEMDDKKGTSLVLINNQKGENLFNNIDKNNILKIKEIPLQIAKNSINKTIYKAIKPYQNRQDFFNNFEKFTFNTNVNAVLRKKYDIGIVGLYTGNNYGTSIQYYNLYTVIRDLGYSVLMISRPRNFKLEDLPEKYNIPKRFKENPYPKTSLINKLYKNKSQMKELNNIVDKFIVGSDQFFRNHLYKKLGEYISLDWVDDSKSKNGYAISFGLEKFEGDKQTTAKLASDLQKFDNISVREKSGITLLKNTFNVEAEETIDPCFLGKHEVYEELILKSSLKLPEKFLFAYILDENNEKSKILNKASKLLKLKLFKIGDPNKKNKNIYVEDWLKAFQKAEYVITDSFHGICMALVFEKKFLYIPNKFRGITRFKTLNENFGIKDRMINSLDELPDKIFKEINYNEINNKINYHKEKSLNYLKKILHEKKEPQNSLSPTYEEYDSLNELKSPELRKKYLNKLIYYKLKYEYYRTILNFCKGKKYDLLKAKKDKYKNIINYLK